MLAGQDVAGDREVEVVEHGPRGGRAAEHRTEHHRAPRLADGHQGPIPAPATERGDQRRSAVARVRSGTYGDQQQGQSRQAEHAGHGGQEHRLGFVVGAPRSGLRARREPPVGRRSEADDDIAGRLVGESVPWTDVGEPFGRLVESGGLDGPGQPAVAMVDVLGRPGLPQRR
ncbi:hypothetical protein ACGFZL_20180 [Streptomyces sp. NPDC048182]|uniref:hypothetical protein n=1 Tax=Streptomyces sp. NPDC048182 TaxID=3365507 RepID=UPI00371F713B